MAVKRIDENTVEYSQSNLKVTVRTSDEYCTIRCNDRPMGTLQRKRAMDRSDAPRWSLYDVEGNLVRKANWVSTLLIELRLHLCL